MVDSFDRFTERARKVLTLAQEEAQRFNHNYIGTEHLLLGLVREGDGVAARVLSNLGVQLPKVRSAVEFIIGRGEGMVVGEIGLTPRAKKVIELAVDEVRRLNHHYIGTEHLLLGLVREGEGIAAGVLESLGVSLEKVRAQVMQVVNQSGGYGQSRRSGTLGQPAMPVFPRLRTLLDIVPILQQRDQAGIAVTLIALERYAEGFVATFTVAVNLRFVDPAQAPDVPITWTIAARDDLGGAYQGRVEGLRWADDLQWRLFATFAPGLPPEARRVDLELPALHVLETPEQEDDIWSFSVTLPDATTEPTSS